jgi:hypothetical protein
VKRQGRGPSRRERRKAEQARPKPHDCEDARRVATTCRLLGELGAGGHQTVLIGRVLELLDPGHKHVPAAHPLADPMLGTLPVDAASYQEPS